MTLQDYRSITEPERIRALAHPTRLELLDYLQEAGEATATQCARRIGESVASCSFHLRMLGKYGYIERAQRRGREKPWRVPHGTRDIRPAPEVTGSLSAVAELAALVVLHEGERLRRFITQAHGEPDEWIQATTVAGADFWVTAEELAELSRRVQHLADEYLVRNTDATQRPAGARRARLFAALNPDPVATEAAARG